MPTTMEDLAVALGSAPAGTVVLAIAVYPRHGHTGHLAEQGLAIAEMERSLLKSVVSVRAFRTLWSQLLVVAPPGSRKVVEGAVVQGAQRSSTETIEIRAVWCTSDGPKSIDWLDAFWDELSIRSSFGSCRWIDGRMIDGRIV